MEEMIVKLPKGIEERMEILIAENLYANKTEIINDALRRLIESELSVLINSHKYYWKKPKSEKDVEILGDDLDRMIQVRKKRSA